MNIFRRYSLFTGIAMALLAASMLLFSTVNAGQDNKVPDAATTTQAFAVENMTCATCPITVKEAMNKLDGVISVKVDLESESANVEYNPAIVSADEISAASTNVGFPTSLLD